MRPVPSPSLLTVGRSCVKWAREGTATAGGGEATGGKTSVGAVGARSGLKGFGASRICTGSAAPECVAVDAVCPPSLLRHGENRAAKTRKHMAKIAQESIGLFSTAGWSDFSGRASTGCRVVDVGWRCWPVENSAAIRFN